MKAPLLFFWQIRLIAGDVYRTAVREKMMYGFLLLSFLFILMANVPYMVADPKVFENQPALTSSLQIGFVAIHIFILLIAVFVSLNTMQNYLAFERLVLLLSRPVRRWQIMAGVLLGLYQMILINWFLMTMGIWLVVLSHERMLLPFVWSGLSVAALLGILYVSLVVFFYCLMPNMMAGVLTIFVVIAGFGVSSARLVFARLGWPVFFEKAARLGLNALPQINALLGISMKELRFFHLNIPTSFYIFQSFLLIAALGLFSCSAFERRSQF